MREQLLSREIKVQLNPRILIDEIVRLRRHLAAVKYGTPEDGDSGEHDIGVNW